MNAVTDLCFALVVVAGAAPCAAVSAQVGAVPRDSGPVFPRRSELGWFTDGSYTAIVLGNYDLPGASAIYRKLMEFLAVQ